MKNLKKIYLLGAGGMGMASLAKYLYDKGYFVLGWDDYASEERRNQLNYIKWTEKIPEECSICVRSSAISIQHPIFKSAQNHCQCYLRGEFIAELLSKEKLCVVCGSHGKSTTTAYLIHFFKYHNIPVNYLLGAEFQKDFYAAASYQKEAEWTLLELDESDGTIDLFSPDISLILNTDWDHPAYYKTIAAYRNTFNRLVRRTKKIVLTNENFRDDHAVYKRVDESFNGLNQDEIFACKAFELLTQQKFDKNAIKTFPGIKRRQEILLKTKYLTILSDYAHHPSELRALLDNFDVNSSFHLVFEPHRASRLNQYFEDFIRVLKPVENLYLCPIYEAFEHEKSSVKSLKTVLPNAFTFEQLKVEDFIPSNVVLKSPVTIIFAGAGNVDCKARAWVAQLKQEICAKLRDNGVNVSFHYNLKHVSLIMVGGSALGLACPKNIEELQQLIFTCNSLGLNMSVLGGGSNLLIPDEEYPGVVIRLKGDCWNQVQKKDAYIYKVGAGLVLSQFLNLMEEKGIGGFEFLDGIPGTLGGALSMNAGTQGIGILDRMLEINIIDFSGKHHLIKRQDLHYGYRCCDTLKNCVILDAVLQGELSSPEKIKSLRNLLKSKRCLSQPQGASLGCFFKNTMLGSAGKLIDQLGLKDIHVGDIFVSSKHANFIVNKGGGTYNDVLKLVSIIRNRVKEKTGIVLEPEVRLLGKEWEQIL